MCIQSGCRRRAYLVLLSPTRAQSTLPRLSLSDSPANDRQREEESYGWAFLWGPAEVYPAYQTHTSSGERPSGSLADRYPWQQVFTILDAVKVAFSVSPVHSLL
jgi:hypothetical protein